MSANQKHEDKHRDGATNPVDANENQVEKAASAKSTPIPDLEIDDLAKFFPEMSEEEFRALKDDIEKNGLRMPIVKWRGKLLDGRNRYKAIKQLEEEGKLPPGFEFKSDVFEGNDKEALAYVLSVNRDRRDLKETQRAILAYELIEKMKNFANGISRDKAAEEFKVSSGTVGFIITAKKNGLIEAFYEKGKKGEISANLMLNLSRIDDSSQITISEKIEPTRKKLLDNLSEMEALEIKSITDQPGANTKSVKPIKRKYKAKKDALTTTKIVNMLLKETNANASQYAIYVDWVFSKEDSIELKVKSCVQKKDKPNAQLILEKGVPQHEVERKIDIFENALNNEKPRTMEMIKEINKQMTEARENALKELNGIAIADA